MEDMKNKVQKIFTRNLNNLLQEHNKTQLELANYEDLLTDTPQEQTYYANPETAKVAQEIFDNSDLRILFDAAKDSSPEQLKLAAEMLRQFKKTSGEDND